MKKSKAFAICKEIMDSVIERGFINQVHKRELERIIILKRGMDKRTIRNWLRTLEILGFIKLVNPFVYELDFSPCKELLVKVIKYKKQKKLM